MVELKCYNHGVLHITDTLYAGHSLLCKACHYIILDSVYIDMQTGELFWSKPYSQELEKLGITFEIKPNKS
jgi:hypothetical protein